MTSPRLYLLDVEGTTSPISLVSEQLFPYARRHLRAYLQEHWQVAEVQGDLALLLEESRAKRDEKQILRFAQDDNPGGGDRPFVGAAELDSVIAYLDWLMDRDRKSTALKSLQGKIWKAGFEAGELVGTVFPDVPEALARWTAGGARIAIYSSGSVEAQQLLFRHSSAGDLTPYLAGFFDTRMGAKTLAASYAAIARAAKVDAGEVLFLSDVLRELDPAREAGCQTRLLLREGNAPVPDHNGHLAIASLADVD